MRRVLTGVMLTVSLFLIGCSGQKTYYWERPDTGAEWFVRDHTQCLRTSDWWPYYMPGWRLTGPWGWGTPPDYDLRFDNDAGNGIWAEFTPFPGAQPIYVNSLRGDWSMQASTYEECMEDRQYRQYKPKTTDREVFQQ